MFSPDSGIPTPPVVAHLSVDSRLLHFPLPSESLPLHAPERISTMANQPPQAAISSPFPAPPPFYKSFTSQNLEAQETYLEDTNQPTSGPLPTRASGLDLFSLPPELRNLFPPAPPPDGKYRSFGVEHDVSIPHQRAPSQDRIINTL